MDKRNELEEIQDWLAQRRNSVSLSTVGRKADLKRQLVRSLARRPMRHPELPGNRRVSLRSRVAGIALALVFLVGSAGAVTASASSLPGDTFYPLKLFIEDVRFSLATDPDARSDLMASFIETRLDELAALEVRGEESGLAISADRLARQLARAEGLASNEELRQAIAHSQQVLEGLHLFIPEEALQGIESALELGESGDEPVATQTLTPTATASAPEGSDGANGDSQSGGAPDSLVADEDDPTASGNENPGVAGAVQGGTPTAMPPAAGGGNTGNGDGNSGNQDGGPPEAPPGQGNGNQGGGPPQTPPGQGNGNQGGGPPATPPGQGNGNQGGGNSNGQAMSNPGQAKKDDD